MDNKQDLNDFLNAVLHDKSDEAKLIFNKNLQKRMADKLNTIKNPTDTTVPVADVVKDSE